MAIIVKKSPGWTSGQGMKLSGTGPGMVVQSSGGGGGGLRPLIDANHIHVWNCDETSGASVLVDSVGGKNLTLQGGEGTAYALNQSAGGSAYPWVQSLLVGGTAPIASASGMGLNLSATTFEFVVRFTATPGGGAYQSLSRLESTSAPFDYAYTAITNYAGSPKIFGGAYNDGPYPAGSFTTTTITNYDAPDISISADTTYYVMWTYDSTASGQQKIYINGVLKNTVTGVDVTLSNLDLFTLGGISGSAQTLLGYIRDVRISNIVRDATYAAAAAAALTT